MKLKYKSEPSDNGGSAVLGCGTIHKSEIKATLDKLSTTFPCEVFGVNLNDFVLGSTGKREYSGDIDLVLDSQWCKMTPADFMAFLRLHYPQDAVAKNGAMVHLRFPIVGFDPSKDEVKPRTGFVQIDFNFGDAAWEKVYHFSPGDASAYKGAHRNLAIAAITTVVDIKKSDEVDTFNRPVVLTRWKWSPHGFVRVIRVSKRDKYSNMWMKKQEDTVVKGPIFDADQIAKILFEDGTAKDIESLETIIAAVKRNFGMVDQERIWQRMAGNFRDWKDGRNFEYPSEIAAYFQPDDK